jgi:hypothetical protein
MRVQPFLDETLAHYPALLSAELLVLITIFALGVIWKYCVRTFVAASDYWARRSISSRRKRIDSLERTLAKYEADFADQRLFIGRIVRNTLFAISYLIVGGLSLGIAVAFAIVNSALCELHPGCVEQSAAAIIWYSPWLSWELSAAHFSVVFVMVAIYAAVGSSVCMQTVLLEISPEKYRARFGDRIARLRDRIPTG